MLKKTEKTPAEAVGTACLDVCEDVSSGEQAPRASPLTPIISAKSPLRLAKNIKKLSARGWVAACGPLLQEEGTTLDAFYMFFSMKRGQRGYNCNNNLWNLWANKIQG